MECIIVNCMKYIYKSYFNVKFVALFNFIMIVLCFNFVISSKRTVIDKSVTIKIVRKHSFKYPRTGIQKMHK